MDIANLDDSYRMALGVSSVAAKSYVSQSDVNAAQANCREKTANVN